jgi:hypothetical protein
MKLLNLFLLLGLISVLAISTNVLADCWNPDCWDANNVWSSEPYCVGDVAYRNYAAYYECDYSVDPTGICEYVGTGPHVYDNCTLHAEGTCLNGDYMSFRYRCVGAGECKVLTDSVDIANYGNCELCANCMEPATEPRSLAQTYTKVFTGNYVIENGTYYVSPNSRMSLTSINSITYNCGNTMLYQRRSSLFVWVYNITGEKKTLKHNGVAIDDSLNRSEVLGDTSDPACGTAVTNPYDTMLFGYPLVHNRTGIANSTLPNIYNFVTPGKYNVYIDAMGAYCGPITPLRADVTQNYICPWLGGDLSRSDNCKSDVGRVVDGWNEREDFMVVIPNPNITIAAPSSEASLNVTKIQKTWNITNRGVGRITMNITYDCGNWTCAFDGYNGNPIPLEENEAYIGGIKLNITITSPGVNHLVGILIRYDEGYGLSAIPPRNAASYITITTGNATNATTLPSVSVALNQPASGSIVPDNPNLNYTVRGSNNTYSVTLNLNGNATYRTDFGKLNNTPYIFPLTNLSPGLYWWNVTAYINSSVYNTSETRNFTVASVVPLVSVDLDKPDHNSIAPSNVTLNYTVRGSNNTYNVSLNLNSNPNNKTDFGKLNNTRYNFTFVDLNPGVYWWNVTAYINSSVYNTSETRNFTVASPAGPTQPIYIT